jgi:hypothetical protein
MRQRISDFANLLNRRYFDLKLPNMGETGISRLQTTICHHPRKNHLTWSAPCIMHPAACRLFSKVRTAQLRMALHTAKYSIFSLSFMRKCSGMQKTTGFTGNSLYLNLIFIKLKVSKDFQLFPFNDLQTSVFTFLIRASSSLMIFRS